MTERELLTIPLRGAMGLRNAGEFATTLGAAIEGHPAVTIIADDLEEVDISILQVLLAGQKTAARAGKAFAVSAPPDGVLSRTLIKAGLLRADGSAPSPDAQFWLGADSGAKGGTP